MRPTMLLDFLTGLPVILLCLVLQTIFVVFCLRQYVNLRHAWRAQSARILDFLLLSMVMLLMLIGNLIQMGIWAALYMVLGEFSEFSTALYFSAVTFATLGYGDIVLTERWRLLSPIEAANGILMFGLSTAFMTAAVMDIIKSSRARILKSDLS
jgi:hypothetical protein